MYINPFIAGALFVVFVELVGLFLASIVAANKEDDDGQEK